MIPFVETSLARYAWPDQDCKDGGLSSIHQSLGDYFEGETPCVLIEFTDHVLPALNTDFLNALSQSLHLSNANDKPHGNEYIF